MRADDLSSRQACHIGTSVLKVGLGLAELAMTLRSGKRQRRLHYRAALCLDAQRNVFGLNGLGVQQLQSAVGHGMDDYPERSLCTTRLAGFRGGRDNGRQIINVVRRRRNAVKKFSKSFWALHRFSSDPQLSESRPSVEYKCRAAVVGYLKMR